MKTIIFILAICLFGHINGQSIARDIQKIDPDSCLITVSKVVSKEMITTSQAPIERELAIAKLATDDMEVLLKKLSKKSSYQDSRALLTHSNVALRFYKGDTVCSSLNISTFTGNIEIYNPATEEQFYSNVSHKLSCYLIVFFKKLEVWEVIEPFDKQGLESLE